MAAVSGAYAVMFSSSSDGLPYFRLGVMVFVSVCWAKLCHPSSKKTKVNSVFIMILEFLSCDDSIVS